MPANPYSWPDLAALGSVGSVTTGGGAADGAIRDLSIAASTYSAGGLLSFAWEQDVEGSHYCLVYVDGAAVGTATPGEPFTLPPVGDGDHSLHVIPVRIGEALTPDVPTVTANGDQVLLTWLPSSSADVVAYRVYWDAASGTVDTDTVLATVDFIESPVTLATPVTSGTGSGVLDIDGTYRGPACNADWTVTIETGGLTWTYSTQDGASGESIAIRAGVLFNLPYGVRVAFPSALADYDAGDSWTFHVGPQTRYVTDALPAGTYKFQIGAVDAAGNESTLASAIAVAVAPEPQPPTDIAGTWDAGTSTVSLSWTASETAGATYAVYSDYSGTFDTVLDHIDEDAPIATASGTSADIVLTTAPDSAVRFYVRAVASGVEERNADMLSVDCYATPLASLAAPRVTAVTPTVGGEVTMDWQQDISSAVPDSYNVYRTETGSWDDAVLVENVTPAAASSTRTSPTTNELTWTSAEGYDATPAYWGVRAVDADDAEGPDSNLVAATPDATAPNTPTGFEGVPI